VTPRGRGPTGLLLTAFLSIVPLAAEATPVPLLAPEGLFWAGTLPPAGLGGFPSYGEHRPEPSDPRGVWLVDPKSGDLWVLQSDLEIDADPVPLAIERIWTGNDWTYLGFDRIHRDGQVFTVRRPGFDSQTFEAVSSPERGSGCPDGTILTGQDGSTLACGATSFVVTSPSGARATFDGAGLIEERRGPLGGTLRYSWEIGQPSGLGTGVLDATWKNVGSVDNARIGRTVSAPGGLKVTEEYENGLLVAVGNGNGIRTRYFYDARGLLSGALFADGSRLAVERDDQSRVVSMSGPGTASLRFAWGDGGLVAVSDPLGNPWRLEWREDDVSVTDPVGRTVWLLREGKRIDGWVDPMGTTTHLGREGDGRLTNLSVAGGASWSLAMNLRGLLEGALGPMSAQWRFERDADGLLTRIVDPDGRDLRLDHDSQGRVDGLDHGPENVRLERDEHGLITAIRRDTGSLRIGRDVAGRILSISDASGNAWRFEGQHGRWPGRLVDPSGVSWKLVFDPLGRPKGLFSEAGDDAVQWSRDERGALVDLKRGASSIRFGRRLDGLLTLVRDPFGRVTGWARNGAGQVQSIQQADGSSLEISRNGQGEVSRVDFGDTRIQVDRDARGLPTRLRRSKGAAPAETLLQVRWDALGHANSVAWRSATLALKRTVSGLVKEVKLGDEVYGIGRNAAGRVVSVDRGASNWRLDRDTSGLVRAVNAPGLTWALGRDSRGLPAHLEAQGIDVTWMYDAAGRVQLEKSSDGTTLGVAWDAAGRPVTIRFPGGTLAWLAPAGDGEERIESNTGRVLLSRFVHRDGLGRLVTTEQTGRVRRYRYGPLDQVVAVEDEAGAWSYGPRGSEGPDGELVLLDVDGRPLEAVPPHGPPAWGVGSSRVSYQLDASGAFEEVSGDGGQALLRHDVLGRLVSLETRTKAPDGGDLVVRHWKITYDPLGLGVVVHGPDGTVRLVTALGLPVGWAGSAGSTSLLEAPNGAMVAVGPGAPPTAVWPDELGNPGETWLPGEKPDHLGSSPAGFPSSRLPILLARGGRFLLFAGGPMVSATRARDAVSGQETGARPVTWPWAEDVWDARPESWPEIDVSPCVSWDPSAWAPRSAWQEPLRILVALGIAGLPEAEASWLVPPVPSTLPWLPSGLEGGSSPFGLSLSLLPLRADPLERLLIGSLLSARLPVTTDNLLHALLEVDLKEIPPLLPDQPVPPGLAGLTDCRDASARSR
jgi:YD repeat-containing protein